MRQRISFDLHANLYHLSPKNERVNLRLALKLSKKLDILIEKIVFLASQEVLTWSNEK